jgi:FkbM family methyltransferase
MKRAVITLYKILKFNGSLTQKVSILLFFSKLKILNLINPYSNNIFSFLKFKIIGVGNRKISYLINEIFLNNEYYFKCDNKTPFIIDCGSNIGISILYFKYLYPNCEIIGFEANPYTYEVLQKNVFQNDLKNVKINNLALSNSKSELKFYIDESNYGSLTGSINSNRGGKKELIVNADKLSNYINNIDTIDLVKMDVEGAEFNIINDLFNENLISKVNQYIIEYHLNVEGDDSLNTLSSFLNKFEQNGFRYSIRANSDNNDSFQDVLIHFYKKNS